MPKADADNTTPSPGHDRAPSSRSAEPHREQSAHGTYQIPTAVLDQIPEEHRTDLFILMLDGNCLEPEAHHNDRAIVAPGMPIRPGDFVVLWPKNPEHRPLMKRVVLAPPADWAKWSPDSEVIPITIVEQFNPPRQYHVTTDKLAAIHRVVTTFGPGDHERVSIKPRPLKRQPRAAGGAL